MYVESDLKLICYYNDTNALKRHCFDATPRVKLDTSF